MEEPLDIPPTNRVVVHMSDHALHFYNIMMETYKHSAVNLSDEEASAFALEEFITRAAMGMIEAHEREEETKLAMLGGILDFATGAAARDRDLLSRMAENSLRWQKADNWRNSKVFRTGALNYSAKVFAPGLGIDGNRFAEQLAEDKELANLNGRKSELLDLAIEVFREGTTAPNEP